MKELAKDTMTWLVFLKALRFLQAVEVEFIVRIRWKTKRVTEHSATLDLTGPETVGHFWEFDEEADHSEHPSKDSKDQE
jgi:hypothetical protein